MALASRDDFLKSTVQRRYAEVVLPVAGLTVRVQSLTEGEKSRFERAVWDSKGKAIPARMIDSKARLIGLCLVDADGRKLLDPEDTEAIQQLDGKDTSFLWDYLWDFTGFSAADADKIAKN